MNTPGFSLVLFHPCEQTGKRLFRQQNAFVPRMKHCARSATNVARAGKQESEIVSTKIIPSQGVYSILCFLLAWATKKSD